MNVKKLLCFILIACLFWNLSFSAEGFSAKLRGKLALVGILSGIAFLTHTLTKRDIQASETLQFHLGSPERVFQYERGFDYWNIHYYREHSYYYLNNRFKRKKTNRAFFLPQTTLGLIGRGFSSYNSTAHLDTPILFSPTDTPVSVNPKWLSLFPWHQRLIRQSAIPYLHQSASGHLPLPEQRLQHLR